MKRLLLILIGLFLLVATGFPQAKPPIEPGKKPPDLRLIASRVSEPVKIDGVLNEAAWTAANVISDFYQQEPKEGKAASEKTEIRVLFDDKNIYFAIRAFDSEPSKINAREFVRDASFSNDDKVEILLDTFHAYHRRRPRRQPVVGRRVDF
jgi:Carbohydrate family 9 binding domain-like